MVFLMILEMGFGVEILKDWLVRMTLLVSLYLIAETAGERQHLGVLLLRLEKITDRFQLGFSLYLPHIIIVVVSILSESIST